MYGCYDVKRFFRLLLLDAIIFSLIYCFMGISKHFIFSSADYEEKVFLPVIMYHSISERSSSEYSVTPEQIESDLKYLSENGYNTVSAQQLADYVYSNGDLPENPVMITLDDGFYNNFYYLEPLLEKYDMNVIVSVVGTYIENNAVADPHVPEYSYLLWDDIKSMLESGRFEIGNHTYNLHTANNRLGSSIKNGESNQEYAEILDKDISYLQTLIKENTDVTPIVFAYPYGYECEESIPVLKENGFMITLNCVEKPNYITRNPDSLYSINRYNRSGFYTTEEFMKKALGE